MVDLLKARWSRNSLHSCDFNSSFILPMNRGCFPAVIFILLCVCVTPVSEKLTTSCPHREDVSMMLCSAAVHRGSHGLYTQVEKLYLTQIGFIWLRSYFPLSQKEVSGYIHSSSTLSVDVCQFNGRI